MRQDFDAIVVGGGTTGTSSGRSLTERGRSVLLLERFEIGHARGSSGGPTRIFRISYHHPDYVRMARLALEEWRDLEAKAGETLLVSTGGLDVGPGGRETANALEAAGERFEYLKPQAVRERWPSLRFQPDSEILHQEDGGVCMAERTVRAQARLAAEGGATILQHTKVERVTVARSVNADDSPGAAAASFGKSDTVYISMWRSNIPAGAEITARWFGPSGAQITEDKLSTPGGDGYTSFHAADTTGWAPGSYRVEILLNGQPSGTVTFIVM